MNAPETLPIEFAAQEFLFVAPALLHPSPTNPRRHFNEATLAEMAENVKRVGLLQPILVRPWPASYTRTVNVDTAAYEIIAGERRFRSATLAALDLVPVMIRHLDDAAVLEFQVIENLQREDVNELEEAEGYQVLMIKTGYTVEQIAEKVGKSKAYIYARLKLCDLSKSARQLIMDNGVSPSIALLLARIPVPHLQTQAANEVIKGRYGDGPMSARQAAEHIQGRYMLKLADATFPRGDAKLLENTPTCAKCPKRTGNARDQFPDVKSADVCTDPDCWAAKNAAYSQRLLDAAEANGLQVLKGKAAEKVMPYRECHIQSHIDLKEGWVQAEKTVYDAEYNDGYPTWRKLLGEAWKPTAVIVAASGQVVELMQEQDARAAAKASGIAITQRRTGPSEADKKREKQQKEETAFRTLLLRQIISATQGQALNHDDLVEIAKSNWERLWFDHQKLVAKILVDKPNRDGVDEVTAAIGTSLDPGVILTACCLANQVNVMNSYKNGDQSERMLAFAGRRGVDVQAVRQEGMPAAKAKGSAKAKGVMYRHPDPDNSTLTWTGRGKKPKWVEEWLASGGTLHDIQEVTA